MRIPRPIATLKVVTKWLRCLCGASSAMYTGTACDDPPTAKPRKTRASASEQRTRCQGGQDRPGGVDTGQRGDRPPPADPFDGLAARQGADDRADEDRRGHHLLHPVPEVVLGPDVQERPGDDPRVIAVEEARDGTHGRHEEEIGSGLDGHRRAPVS